MMYDSREEAIKEALSVLTAAIDVMNTGVDESRDIVNTTKDDQFTKPFHYGVAAGRKFGIDHLSKVRSILTKEMLNEQA
jgi:hypothetical protein